MRAPRARLALLLAASVGLGVFAVASGSASGAKTQNDVAYATAQIAKYKQIPKFTYKASPVDVAKAKGKTIFTIPISSAIPYIKQTDQLMEKVAKSRGVKWVEFANQGQPSQWVQGMQQAVARKADLIVLQGAPPPQLLGPQLAAAKKAKIPVLLTHIIDPREPVPAGVTVAVPAPFQQAARLMADWAISKTSGKANALIIVSNEVLPTKGITAAMLNEFKTQCSGCKTTVVNVPVVDWATKIGTEVKSALTKDPGINYVIPIYDSMAFFAVPAITEAGKQGSVKVATYNGTPDVLKFLQANNVVDMEVGENLDWLANANMDAAFRILAGAKVPTKLDQKTPLRIFDATNVSQAGKPPKFNVGYGNAYKVGYTKLWGAAS